ncbi:sulfurtransferase complex subunit TusC [Candidatus Pantoea edessiphila]|uniref:Sulfurtransferase complex subunit TusC n=1 Tax=Candidatus Pantoea edessiphila TaxID=2044610 RepID=A0A2P5SXU0_9GAMM|nr:sulfurtransferase complex subunit TusC [Candidatus Pantoea edessiphila]MBK4775771.1 sulfurtransferase complex subunit TusC [Pantoea sp. Edef]PPI87167.1 sulfurtransferase complex subunit TusC [Candidatus Pantoea edessiphila]
MKSIAFVFSHMPYGSSSGLEGLNAALAIGESNKNLGIFFIGDGVLQLNSTQNPELIFNRHYYPTFYILKLYGIKKYYLSLDSLIERGLSVKEFYGLGVKIVNSKTLTRELISYDHILTF